MTSSLPSSTSIASDEIRLRRNRWRAELQAVIGGPRDAGRLRAGVAFPYECNSGSCGCCRFELLSGTVEVAWLEAPAWTDRDRRKGRYLGCQTCATSDAVIRVMPDEKVLAGQRPQKFNAILSAKRWVTHDMCMLVFHSDGPAEFLPGQYAIVRAPGVPARCYSMSNLPNDSGDWEFIVRRVPGGKSSEAIVDSELGAPFELDGPYGMAFFREAEREDLVCVAGGSGSPRCYRSHAPQMRPAARWSSSTVAAVRRTWHAFAKSRRLLGLAPVFAYMRPFRRLTRPKTRTGPANVVSCQNS